MKDSQATLCSLLQMNGSQRTACLAKGYTVASRLLSWIITHRSIGDELSHKTQTEHRTWKDNSKSYVWPVPLPDNKDGKPRSTFATNTNNVLILTPDMPYSYQPKALFPSSIRNCPRAKTRTETTL